MWATDSVRQPLILASESNAVQPSCESRKEQEEEMYSVVIRQESEFNSSSSRSAGLVVVIAY